VWNTKKSGYDCVNMFSLATRIFLVTMKWKSGMQWICLLQLSS
jgi:hypothetical protein